MPENKSPNVRSFCLSNFFGSKTESKVPTAKRGANKAIKIVNIRVPSLQNHTHNP